MRDRAIDGRPLGRIVLALAVLLLGLVAAGRLPLRFLPQASFPELTIQLSLPDATDPVEVGRRWAVPLEAAARSLGGVRGMTGQVSADGVLQRVRFVAGTDPLRKASRLESELTDFRRRLPPQAGLRVAPATQSQGDLAAVLWYADPSIGRDDRSEELAEALRAVAGVRQVDVIGQGSEELRLRVRPQATTREAAIAAAVAEALQGSHLGHLDRAGRRLPVVSAGELASLDGTPRARGGSEAAKPLPSAHSEGDPWAGRLAAVRRLPVPTDSGAVPLGALVDGVRRRLPPDWMARYRGEDGLMLQIWREHDASPLAVVRDLERALKAPGGTVGTGTVDTGTVGTGTATEIVYSEAEPLRRLLRRLAGGALAASLFAGVFGWRWKGARAGLGLATALPLGVAAAANALWLAGIPLDVLTLTAAGLACGALLPLAFLRLAALSALSARPSGEGPSLERTAALSISVTGSALALPVAVALASGDLAPLLAPAARAFLLALLAGALVQPLILNPGSRPTGASRRRSFAPEEWAAKLLRGQLRDPLTALLGGGAAAYALLAFFGPALEPRSGSLVVNPGQLQIQLSLAEGTTLAETSKRVREVEARLETLDAVHRYWSVFDAGEATTVVDLDSRHRRPERLQRLQARLEYQLTGAGAAATVQRGNPGSRGAELRFSNDLEERPETDEEALFYRFILRSADAESLRRTFEHLRRRLLAGGMRSHHLLPDWGASTVRLELQPTSDTAPRQASDLASALHRSSTPPRRWLWPGQSRHWITLQLPGRPSTADEVPQRRGLLAQPLRLDTTRVEGTPTPGSTSPGNSGITSSGIPSSGKPSSGITVPAARLIPRERLVSPSLLRQSGRYVLPVTVRFPYFGEDRRKEERLKTHRALVASPLPPGTDLERPSLSPFQWRVERWRLLGLAGALPALLLAAGAFRLNSAAAGLACLTPGLVGVAAATPVVWAGPGNVDEMTLLALGAALCASFPLALETAAAILRGDRPEPGRRLLRPLAQRGVALWAGVAALAAIGWGPAVLGDAAADSWEIPLRAAAAAGTAALLATVTVLPALLQAGLYLKHRDRAEEERRRRPPSWRREGPPRLAVRHLTKTYGGRHRPVRALRAVDFELEPGIVGLLGPNGAGKTTLLRLLTGLLEPTRGQVLYNGEEVLPESREEYRRFVGFLPQEFNAYADFTAEQFLDYWALERGMERAARERETLRLLETVGLAEHASRKVREFSGGMRQRVGIARALLGDPPILVVDEPTTGLDIESRDAFRETLLASAGRRIILFSTHIASDIEAAASRILMLHRGRLRFDGTPEGLVDRARGRVGSALIADSELREFGRSYRLTARVRTLDGIRVRAVAAPGQELVGEPVEPSLEEAYLSEVDRADVEAGLTPRKDRFAFLDEAL